MKKIVLIASLLPVLMLGGAGGWLALYAISPSQGQGEAIVSIVPGSGLREIGAILNDKGLLSNDIRFLILGRLSGLANQLKAGEFSVPYGLTPGEVLQVLADGKVIQHKITIPEGLTLQQIATVFAQKGWVDEQDFLRLAVDQDFLRALGIQAQSLEGYLFPETYLLTKYSGVNAERVIRLMVKRFFQVWASLGEEVNTAELSQHQIVTLASIVEKETGAAFERPLIARVFLNRLERKMRLQSDPTIIYGLKDFDGDITFADIRRPTPYNTYVIQGLPPGPICSPGRDALWAVLHPQRSSALYFVSKNDGTHIFSNSLREHNRAVRKYQKQKKNI